MSNATLLCLITNLWRDEELGCNTIVWWESSHAIQNRSEHNMTREVYMHKKLTDFPQKTCLKLVQGFSNPKRRVKEPGSRFTNPTLRNPKMELTKWHDTTIFSILRGYHSRDHQIAIPSMPKHAQTHQDRRLAWFHVIVCDLDYHAPWQLLFLHSSPSKNGRPNGSSVPYSTL